MKTELFFELNELKAIPIHLLTSSQWQDAFEQFTAVERNYFSSCQFKAAQGESCFIYNTDGLIEKAYFGCEAGTLESALAQAALVLPPGNYRVNGELSAQMALYWVLAQYRFTEYKTHELKPRKLFINEPMMKEVLALADAVFLVRDLINRPANDMGPQHLAEVMENLANTYDAQFEQWIGNELVESNFPGIHAVGRASINAPRLLSLTWGKEKNPRITLVGKGVCFDTGGLDIKPSSGMRMMKKDMAGAAHVIGLAQWIMQRQLPIRLQVLVPAVENSIGPDAFRPGDVLKMRNGLTVEIDNTDAEGRLILADALVKACEDKPDLLIDFATLTGAARAAVGTELSALFCNNDKIAEQIIASSNIVLDPIWRLPLFSAYDELLNSTIADMSNCSTVPYGGAIIAGLFLQRFVDKATPWLHFDMMGWNISNKPGKPEGGEAMGIRAIAHYLLQVYG